MSYEYDIIIIGGGPAGSTMALSAARHNLKVLLVDKTHFPRDKVCGDVLPPESISLLHTFNLFDTFIQEPHCHTQGMLLFSETETLETSHAYYVSRRTIFDTMLVEAAKAQVDTREGWNVDDLLVQDDQVYGIRGKADNGEPFTCTAKVVAGADGYGSIVSRKRGIYKRDWRHWAAGCRAYYRNVDGCSNKLEFHFFRTYMPGYLWIFPVDATTVNVGVLVFGRALKEKDLRMRDLHAHLRQSPRLQARFAQAEQLGDIRAWNQAVATTRRPMHGNGFILAGDAAGLTDPLWGYGIGAAMVSGNIAGEVLASVCRGNSYQAHHLQRYSDRVWEHLGPEFWFHMDVRQILMASTGMSPMAIFKEIAFEGAGDLYQGVYPDQ